MPPFVGWYQGPQAIITLIHQQCPADEPGDMRLIPLTANGQPAAAMYMRDGDGHVPFQLHVLDLRADGVSRVVAFLDTALFAKFVCRNGSDVPTGQLGHAFRRSRPRRPSAAGRTAGPKIPTPMSFAAVSVCIPRRHQPHSRRAS